MGEEASPTKCAQWYQALLQNVRMFDAMCRAVARNGPRISAIKFQKMDTIAMVILEARDNIVAADGVQTDVENAVQWVSLNMMKFKQILISSEDPSQQLNLKLQEVFEKSLNTLKQKSINENVKKSSYDDQSAIFHMIQGLVRDEEPGVVKGDQETYPDKHEPLDAISEEETPPDDDKNDETQEANKSIFDRPDQHALEDKNLREKGVLTESKEDSDEDLYGSNVTAMGALQDFIEKKETQARNLIFDETCQNVSDDKLLENNDDYKEVFSEDFTENTKIPEGTLMDETKKPTDDAIGDVSVKPLNEVMENLIKTETKTRKSNTLKDSFFDIESEAALKKHDARKDEESIEVEAILQLPFNPGIKKEPIAEEKDVKKCSEISIFDPKIQEFQLERPSVVVCLRIIFLFPDQRTRSCSEASQMMANSAQLATASVMRSLGPLVPDSPASRSGWDQFSTNINLKKSSRRRRTWH
jgi:hypothetical protein